MAEEGLEYLLANSPFGGLEDMISGVKKHFERTMNLLEGEGEAKLVTSTKNLKCSEEEGFGIYVDHASKNQYKVDYSSRKLIEVTPLTEELNSKSQELVDVIGMGLKKYLEEFFSKNSHLYVYCNGDMLNFGFTAKTVNVESKYSGFWNSEWTLNTADSKVEGIVKLFAYLHEDSNNLFFNDEKSETFELENKSGSAKETAQETFNGVMNVERKLVKRLHQHFEEEAEECLKVLRLALPITQCKLDWNIHLTNVYSQLNAASK